MTPGLPGFFAGGVQSALEGCGVICRHARIVAIRSGAEVKHIEKKGFRGASIVGQNNWLIGRPRQIGRNRVDLHIAATAVYDLIFTDAADNQCSFH